MHNIKTSGIKLETVQSEETLVHIFHHLNDQFAINHKGDVMVSMLAASAVNCGYQPWSGQTKDYEIDICCFSA